jgi:hypothetical protein
MRIQINARGRGGTTSHSVGKLTLTAQTDREARLLKLFADEASDGNLWFWGPLFWAEVFEHVPKTTSKATGSLIRKVTKRFHAWIDTQK